jgi:hypothetical protein
MPDFIRSTTDNQIYRFEHIGDNFAYSSYSGQKPIFKEVLYLPSHLKSTGVNSLHSISPDSSPNSTTRVILPDTLETISQGAFAGNYNLEFNDQPGKFVIPPKLTSIGM